MSPIFGSESRREPQRAEGDNEEGPKVVINDKRRIDPETGAVRETPAETPSSTFPVDEGGTAGPTGEAVVDDELALAKMEIAERTSDLQRVTAEYANYRKRVDRDREAMVTAAKAGVVAELVSIIDDLDRAEAHGDLTGAFKAVADRFTGTLEKLGLAKFGAEGDAFDPAEHEAVQFSTSADVQVPTVTSVFRRGYHFGDKLLRPAVVVVTGPENETAAAPSDVDEIVDAEIVEDVASGDDNK
ncbi:nucleotide exchange factor GrpE [Nakamurella silvestris]|nr:nucleotide exchange factor GrpE [Nakamurella silvestris]